MTRLRESDQMPQWAPALAILKISKVPFWFIWSTPFIFGYIASARGSDAKHLWWFAVSVIGIWVIESANCIHNELVDQVEDAINQPNRTTLVAAVGEPVLWRLAIAGYAITLFGTIGIAIYVRPLVALLMVAAWLAAPVYNWGLRLKRRPGWAELDIAWATFFGYLAGWGWHRSLSDVPAVVWVVTYFFGVMSLMKDLPDVAGDEAVNAPGIFSLRRRSSRNLALFTIGATPYALLIVLVLAGSLPTRVLWLLPLGVVGAAVMVLAERARQIVTFIAAYELAFFYVHLFMLVLFVLYTPTMPAVLAAVLLLVARSAALALQLAPRFVEPTFSWTGSIRALVGGNG